MNEHLLRVFETELRTQCELVVIGAQVVNANLGPNGNGRVVWFGLQGILIAAANASKLLWGSKKERVLEARRPLRESVGVDDSSALSSRDVRHDFEHFDERLEKWFGGGGHIYLGRNISTPGGIVVHGSSPTDVFGHFDPSTATVTFWEHSADLNAIVAEAERILARLQTIEDRRAGP